VNQSDSYPSPASPRPPGPQRRRHRLGFSEDFRRFFLRGLSALLPTLITLWLLIWVWSFLWENLGQHIIAAIISLWSFLAGRGLMEDQPLVYMRRFWWSGSVLPTWLVQLIGVGLSILIIYMIGLLVGNLIGRTIWRLAEMAVMRVPLVRAIYPAVKQVTDFLLAERKAQSFEGSRVVAVQRDAVNVWSIGLVTGGGLKSLNENVGRDMVTVFIPSTPTSFSGYVVVVPRESVVELPLKVDEAMRLLVSGGVITPDTVPKPGPAPAAAPATGTAPALLPPPADPREPAPAGVPNAVATLGK
jgi:uncharacterized membrane protein